MAFDYECLKCRGDGFGHEFSNNSVKGVGYGDWSGVMDQYRSFLGEEKELAEVEITRGLDSCCQVFDDG